MREINLLPTRRRHENEQPLVGKLRILCSVLLGIVVVLLVVVFGISFYISQEIAHIQTQITTHEDQISALNKNEGYYLLLKQKAGALTKIITERYDFANTYSFFTRYDSPDVRIHALQLAENGTATMRVTAVNSYALDTMLASLISDAPDFFQSINLENVSLSPKGTYDISLTMHKK